MLGSGVCWYGASSVPGCPRMLRRDVVEPDARSCGTGGDQREPVLPDPDEGVALLRQVVTVHPVASSARTLVQEVEQPLAKTTKPANSCTHQRGSTDGVWHTATICVLVGQRALCLRQPPKRGLVCVVGIDVGAAGGVDHLDIDDKIPTKPVDIDDDDVRPLDEQVEPPVS